MTEKRRITPPWTMSSKLVTSRFKRVARQVSRCPRVIAGVLNSAYQKPSYGLGNPTTIYPVSAFITHLVWLEGTPIEVDVMALTVNLDSVICRRCSYVRSSGVGCQIYHGQGQCGARWGSGSAV